MRLAFGLFCDGCQTVLHPVLLRDGLCRPCASPGPLKAWTVLREQARESALRYAGARMTTAGRRVVPHAPHRLGRPMRNGSFFARSPAPIAAPRRHWSEVDA